MQESFWKGKIGSTKKYNYNEVIQCKNAKEAVNKFGCRKETYYRIKKKMKGK